jgi:hypothetical protein
MAVHEVAADGHGHPAGRPDGLLPRRCFHGTEPRENARAGLPGVARPLANSLSPPAVPMMRAPPREGFGPDRTVPLDPTPRPA